MTAIWSDILIGMRPPELDQVDDPAELYLLCNVDVPFEADRIRYFPSQTTRETMFAQTKAELERRQLKFVTIAGSREERYQAAVKAIIAEFPEISRA
jgi:nicotinamide riboside kinase